MSTPRDFEELPPPPGLEDELPPPPGMEDELPPPPGFEDELPPPPGFDEVSEVPPPQSPQEQSEESRLAAVLEERKARWLKIQKQRFKRRINGSAASRRVLLGSLEMPPEHLRKIVSDHADMSSKHFQNDRRSYLGALKYMPHALFKLLENMPQPWEAYKEVKVLYHNSGAVTFVNEIPRVSEPQYVAQWASVWLMMRREKKDRKRFKRMRFPAFDDEEPVLNYSEQILELEVPEPVRMPLDAESEPHVHTWLYETLENSHKWQFTVEEMAELHRLAGPLISGNLSNTNSNRTYLFDKNAFLTAKALNVALPGGPKFEPLFKDQDPDLEDFDEFNFIERVIFRVPIRTEYRVAFPFLYNSQTRAVHASWYHSVMPGGRNGALVEIDDKLDVSDASWDELDSESFETDNFDDFVFEPLFKDSTVDEDTLQTSIALLNAPFPFNKRSGNHVRAQDVAMVKPWYLQRASRDQPVKVRVSHQKLLKTYVTNELHSSPPTNSSRKLLKTLKSTKFFSETTIDWLEAALQVVQQGHNMLNLLIHRKGLTFLHLDFNFNLKPTKTLTTKERKRSRFGNAFHLIRELFKAVKLIVDAHVQYRLGHVDAYQLADALNYAMNHFGQLTGIYRHKYKVMHQIRACKDLKHLIYTRFNRGNVGKGPGCGFWQPSWRTWLFFMRGITPLLERWLGNLLSRSFEGRHSKEAAKTLTKQRVDSYYDLELRDSVMHDILDTMPAELRQKRSKAVLQHLAEAWRCWKANIKWEVPGMPEPVAKIIERYVQAKAKGWVSVAHYNRERLKKGASVEKTVARKNVGRLTRLWLKNEQSRQQSFQKDGPYVTPQEAVGVYTTMVHWLESREFQPVPFPPVSYKNDTKILTLALDNLKEQFQGQQRLTSAQKEELSLIEQAYDSPQEFLSRIKKLMLTQRVFKEVTLEMQDQIDHLVPNYQVDALEKITDAYLDQYLWYESDRRGLFPNWVKPSDSEIAPMLVYNFCNNLNNSAEVWDTDEDQRNVLLSTKLNKVFEKIDLTLLNKLLRLVMDSNLADYLSAKNNVLITYKDMSHVNRLGLIKGLKISPFLMQFYGLVLDLLILGLERASELAGPASSPNDFMRFASTEVEKSSPLRFYMRNLDTVYMFFRFSKEEAQELVSDYLAENPDPNFESVVGYNNKKCWPRESRMRLLRSDVHLGRATFWEIQDRVPKSMARIEWEETMASVYSKDNRNLLFEMCGFEVRMKPIFENDDEDTESAWNLVSRTTKQRTSRAFLQVSPAEVTKFENRIRQILMSSGSTTFLKIASKWNTAVVALFSYFREAIVGTPRLLDVLVKCETRIQNRVKMGLNSKMPNRFPPVVFYTPKELGGLGMLSASHILIPASDLRYSTQTETGISHFRAGMSSDKMIPTIHRYITPWEEEFTESSRVWAEYALKRREALQENRRIGYEDVAEHWDKGVPRISTLFQKERHTLAYDKGHRVRHSLQVYQHGRTSPFAWTSSTHDGRLWNLDNYRSDVIQALGGVETILEHSLFRATGFESWEGLFWEQGSGFEDSLKFKKLTNAQRSGLSQIPNRRFTLWWSPTINRADVYVGFQVQLDLTGIFLHGKIPTLKISLVQMFRAHLWQKIHESVVFDVAQSFDAKSADLGLDYVEKEAIHPRKSYKMSSSSADIVLRKKGGFVISSVGGMFDEDRSTSTANTNSSSDTFWIDVQLRYGDYDSHDISRYVRSKFLDYTSDTQSTYPSANGIMIAIDLAYNMYDAYGTWFPGSKQLVRNTMKEVMKVNPALYVLRERIRKGLQLFQAKPQASALSSTNFGEMFGSDKQFIVDDSNVYRRVLTRTTEGNMTSKPLNGCVTVLDPKSGQLFLKIVHRSVWVGQKRIAQLSKWKAAEEVVALLRALPREEQPNQIVVTHKGLMDPLEVHMFDFVHVRLRLSEMSLPFASLVKVDTIQDIVTRATSSQQVLYNVYDDWLNTVSAFTAFSRLVLLLRAFHVDTEKARIILRPSDDVITQPHHIWPSFSDEQWAHVELQLRDLVLEQYAKTHRINVAALTQSEVRDLILGQEIKPPSLERSDDVKEIESSNAQNGAVVTTKTTNVHGEQIVTVTSSNYGQKQFSSGSHWRQAMFAARALQHRAKNVFLAQQQEFSESATTFVVPHSLLASFVARADSRIVCGAFLYGRSPPDNLLVKEVCCMVVVPQLGGVGKLELADAAPSHGLLSEMEPLGWIRCGDMGTEFPAQELVETAKLEQKLRGSTEFENGLPFISVKVVPDAGSVTVTANIYTPEAKEWAKTVTEPVSAVENGFSDSFAKSAQLLLTENLQGFFLVPETDVWNYWFMGVAWSRELDYGLKLDLPKGFYDEVHRVLHFLNFEEDDAEDQKVVSFA